MHFKVLLGLMLLAATSSHAGTFREGGIRAEFPGEPTIAARPIPYASGRVEARHVLARSEATVLMLSHWAKPAQLDQAKIVTEVFEVTAKTMAYPFRFLAQSKLGGPVTAYEYRWGKGEGAPAVLIQRIYVTPTRVVFVAVANEDDVNLDDDKAAQAFLSSLTFE